MRQIDFSRHRTVIGVMDPKKFNAMVQERAFSKALRRGFAPGHELEDWLEAEAELSNQCHYWYQEVS